VNHLESDVAVVIYSFEVSFIRDINTELNWSQKSD